VRFDDGVRLDAAKVGRACHDANALLLLDVAQCAGALPIDVRALGADFVAGSGYKWLLSPYGTGFFWTRAELIERMRVGLSIGWRSKTPRNSIPSLRACISWRKGATLGFA